MKFEEKYPKAFVGQRLNVNEDTITKMEEMKDCEACNEPTEYFSTSFMAYICSEQCLRKLWTSYRVAISIKPPERKREKSRNFQARPIIGRG